MNRIELNIEFKKRVDNVYCQCSGMMTVYCDDEESMDSAIKNIRKLLKNNGVSIEFIISENGNEIKKYTIYTLSSVIYSVLKFNGVNNIDVIDNIDYKTAVKHAKKILTELSEL